LLNRLERSGNGMSAMGRKQTFRYVRFGWKADICSAFACK
jgi:hypothetical protein